MVAEIHELPVVREWFTDDRSPVRRLQATWHGERRLVVLSLWQGDTCTGTFRLPIAEAGPLIGVLTAGLTEVATAAPRLAAVPAAPPAPPPPTLSQRIAAVRRGLAARLDPRP